MLEGLLCEAGFEPVAELALEEFGFDEEQEPDVQLNFDRISLTDILLLPITYVQFPFAFFVQLLLALFL